jgi:hypothetical protein
MRRESRLIALLGAASLLAVCGGPALTPTEQPTPPPPTTTTTTLPAASQGCGLPPSRRDTCRYENSTFVPQINEAITRVQRERPELFDFTQRHDDLSVLVRDAEGYHEAVVGAIRQTGRCAIFDGEEVAVKESNELSDQYDIITFNGFVRWGDGAYAATCRPARF